MEKKLDVSISVTKAEASSVSDATAPDSLAELVTKDPNFLYIKNFDESKHATEDVTYPQIAKKLYKQFAVPMTIVYFLQFLDKVALNYANVMGFAQDINLVGNQFSNLPTFFFVAYIIAEFFQGFYVIQKFSVCKVLGGNVILWGILTCCNGAVQNYGGAMAVRVILGILESAVVPCMVLITTNFVDKRDGAFFTGVWYSGLGFGQIFGGLISYAFQNVSPTASVEGWRLMFIVIGVINIAAGVYVYFLLPLTPLENKNLTAKEKYVLLLKLSEGKVGVNQHRLIPRQVKEIFMDIQAWLLMLIAVTISFSSNTISTFLAVDIMGFGFTSKQAALLNMPLGVVSILSSMLSTYFIRKGTARFVAISILLVPAVCGGALMSFLPKSNQAGLLVGIYMINTVTAPLGICYSWAGANFAGSTKKIASTAVFVSVGFALANIVSPQTYRVEDAPDYYPAKISMLVTQAASIGLAMLIAGIYYMRNKSRDKEGSQGDNIDNVWADLTDFENREFRYSY